MLMIFTVVICDDLSYESYKWLATIVAMGKHAEVPEQWQRHLHPNALHNLPGRSQMAK